jgi:glucuronate isomerase
MLHPDVLLPADPATRTIARRLYRSVAALPIISPHGHCEPAWFARNDHFTDPATLFVVPDHYVFRMLYSQGVPLESLGVPRADGGPVETDGRAIWRLLARHWHLFRGTPTRLWMEQSFASLFGIEERLDADNADRLYDIIACHLETDAFRPRALFDRFNIEVLSTTDSALDPLDHHRAIRDSGWSGRIITAFRPDAVIDPDFPGFHHNLGKLGEITGEDIATWPGYLAALRNRREYFRSFGATSTDHGHPTAATADLDETETARLFERVRSGQAGPADAELFRAQMLTEMARMSLEDRLIMQIHPGAFRNHNPSVFARFGRDKGADMPTRTDFVHALKPLLDRFGNEPNLTIVLFNLDETATGRELAPLAGHYPALRLGPPWWFYDSPEAMRRFRELATETAGFANTVGFNDDTRAFPSIPARHDVARRVDCSYLARLVAEHTLDEDEAHEVAHDLAYGLAKRTYRL